MLIPKKDPSKTSPCISISFLPSFLKLIFFWPAKMCEIYDMDPKCLEISGAEDRSRDCSTLAPRRKVSERHLRLSVQTKQRLANRCPLAMPEPSPVGHVSFLSGGARQGSRGWPCVTPRLGFSSTCSFLRDGCKGQLVWAKQVMRTCPCRQGGEDSAAWHSSLRVAFLTRKWDSQSPRQPVGIWSRFNPWPFSGLKGCQAGLQSTRGQAILELHGPPL